MAPENKTNKRVNRELALKQAFALFYYSFPDLDNVPQEDLVDPTKIAPYINEYLEAEDLIDSTSAALALSSESLKNMEARVAELDSLSIENGRKLRAMLKDYRNVPMNLGPGVFYTNGIPVFPVKKKIADISPKAGEDEIAEHKKAVEQAEAEWKETADASFGDAQTQQKVINEQLIKIMEASPSARAGQAEWEKHYQKTNMYTNMLIVASVTDSVKELFAAGNEYVSEEMVENSASDYTVRDRLNAFFSKLRPFLEACNIGYTYDTADNSFSVDRKSLSDALLGFNDTRELLAKDLKIEEEKLERSGLLGLDFTGKRSEHKTATEYISQNYNTLILIIRMLGYIPIMEHNGWDLAKMSHDLDVLIETKENISDESFDLSKQIEETKKDITLTKNDTLPRFTKSRDDMKTQVERVFSAREDFDDKLGALIASLTPEEGKDYGEDSAITAEELKGLPKAQVLTYIADKISKDKTVYANTLNRIEQIKADKQKALEERLKAEAAAKAELEKNIKAAKQAEAPVVPKAPAMPKAPSEPKKVSSTATINTKNYLEELKRLSIALDKTDHFYQNNTRGFKALQSELKSVREYKGAFGDNMLNKQQFMGWLKTVDDACKTYAADHADKNGKYTALDSTQMQRLKLMSRIKDIIYMADNDIDPMLKKGRQAMLMEKYNNAECLNILQSKTATTEQKQAAKKRMTDFGNSGYAGANRAKAKLEGYLKDKSLDEMTKALHQKGGDFFKQINALSDPQLKAAANAKDMSPLHK